MQTDVCSRFLAWKTLFFVVAQKESLDKALEWVVFSSQMSPSDVAFSKLLVVTVLKNWFALEQALTRLMKHPLPQKRLDVKLVLMLGMASLAFLKTPAHAAVNTAVELAKEIKRPAFSKLVNAVLHAFLRRQSTENFFEKAPVLPSWLYSSWKKNYPERLESMISSLTQEAPLDISVKSDPDFWAECLDGSVLPTGTVRLKNGGDVSQKKGYVEGAWWVQDASAALPVRLFSDLHGKTAADLCAAPGGKTAQLILRGANVTAFDVSEKRLVRLRENLKRLGWEKKAHVFCRDVEQMDEKNLFDAVLLDAPCSATGTLKRHPDLIFHRREEDVLRLSALQKKFLVTAIDLAKPSGEIVFSTCSLQPEEGEEVIEHILSIREDVVLELPRDPLLKPFLTKQGMIRTFPDGGYDGFFAALLRKK